MKRLRSGLFILLLGLLILLLSAYPANAQALSPNLDFSNPTVSEGNVAREQGRKGLQFRFCYFDDATQSSNCPIPGVYPNLSGMGFPLNLAGAIINVKIGAAAPLACTAGLTPAPGACTYTTVDGDDADGVAILDTVKLLYNGDFPATTAIQYSVTSAVAATGVAQSATDPSTIPFSSGATAPRPPVSLETVVDISGSMGWQAVPGGTVTRIQALKSAAQSYFLALKDHARLGDKLGTVYFSNTAIVFDPTPGGSNLEPAHDPSRVDANQSNVDSQVPTNGTSIGAGLRAANVSGFTADAGADPATRKAIILFSDGEQNVNPQVAVAGANLTIDGVADLNNISICPITLGRQTAPGFVLMQNIANLRCRLGGDVTGRNAHISDSQQTFVQAEIESHFVNLLSQLLVGDKLEIATDQTGKIARNQTVEVPFLANPKDVALSVLISWGSDTSQEEEPLTFQLIAPDGTPVNLTTTAKIGRNVSFTTVKLPLQQDGNQIDPSGKWKVRLLARRLRSPQVNYHVMAIVDDAAIASEFRANVNDPGTGQSIPVQVKLTDNGKPVLGATVMMQVNRPTEGLGDILSNTNVQVQPTFTPDPLDAAGQKLRLLESNPLYASLFQTDNITQPLQDNGQTGDAVAGDGIYSALFSGTREEGHYNFTVNAVGSSDENGNFQRTQKFSVFVRPKPCSTTSTLTQSAAKASSNGSVPVDLNAVPKDCLGNKLGPGYSNFLQLASSQGKPDSKLLDKLDGSYQIRYVLPPKVKDSTVSLTFVGEKLNIRQNSVFLQRSLRQDLGFRLEQQINPGTVFNPDPVIRPGPVQIPIRSGINEQIRVRDQIQLQR